MQFVILRSQIHFRLYCYVHISQSVGHRFNGRITSAWCIENHVLQLAEQKFNPNISGQAHENANSSFERYAKPILSRSISQELEITRKTKKKSKTTHSNALCITQTFISNFSKADADIMKLLSVNPLNRYENPNPAISTPNHYKSASRSPNPHQYKNIRVR